MVTTIAPDAALVVIDVQLGFDDPRWGDRNNPDCEANVAQLLAAWRDTQRPVVVVRHDSVTEGSPLAPGDPGNALRDFVAEARADLLVSKSVNSAFIGEPKLESWLRARGVTQIVICGVQTNMCCETTARMGGNLGFDVVFALDATHTFDLAGPDGYVIPADDLARVTAANLDGEFATVAATAEVLAAL